MNPTPEPERWPILPTPEKLIYESEYWVYAAPSAPESYGACGLRVWRASDNGYIAVVTELTHTPPGHRPYDGLWVTTGAPDIWRALVTAYGAPLTLLEHTPRAEGADVYDQYSPGKPNSYNRRPISHIVVANPSYDDVFTWWLAYGGYLTHNAARGADHSMSQDPKTWCDHDRGVCAINRIDDDEAHAKLAATVDALDERRAQTFPALLGVDELKASAAAADWLDAIRISLTGDENNDDHGTGNLLLVDIHMGQHLAAHGLDPDDQSARRVVYAYGWYALTVAAVTSPDISYRLTPHGMTHITYRKQTATLLEIAADMLQQGMTPPADATPPATAGVDADTGAGEELSLAALPEALAPTEGPAFAALGLPVAFKLRPACKSLGVEISHLDRDGDATNPHGERGEAAQMAGAMRGALELIENGLRGADLQTQHQKGYLTAYGRQVPVILSSLADRCQDSSRFVMEAMSRVPLASRQLSLASLALKVAAHALSASGQLALGPALWDEKRISDGSEDALATLALLEAYGVKVRRDFDPDPDTLDARRRAYQDPEGTAQ